MVATTLRTAQDIGILKRGQTALGEKIDHLEQSLNAKIDGVEQSLGGRLDRVESRIDLVENRLFLLAQDVSEIKGSVQALHERVDLVMRHRHQPTGEVVLTPEELPAD
jgi:hypothetical protein